MTNKGVEHNTNFIKQKTHFKFSAHDYLMIEKNKLLFAFFLITISIMNKVVYKCFVLKLNDTNLKLNDKHKTFEKSKN